MTKQACKIFAIVFSIIAVLGLLSFFGGIRSVNFGVFVFPLILAIIFFILFKKKE